MRVSRFITNRRLFILLGSFIILLVAAGLTVRGQARKATFPEKIIMDVQNTVGGWIYRPISQLTSFLGGIHDLHEMYVENARLQDEMKNYKSTQAQLAMLQADNDRMSQELDYKNKVSGKFTLTAAHVIGRDPTEWNSGLTIDVGTADGVTSNMAVVSPDGSLVGRVAQAGNHSAKVILITDTQVGDGVSVLVQNNTDKQPFGVVAGSTTQSGKLDMSFLDPVAQVSVNDTVVTSNLSKIYPEGIVVGTVESVHSGLQGLTQTAVVSPAANLDYLQDVLVVTKIGAQK